MGVPRTRHTGAVTLLLLAVSTGITAAVAWRLHLDVAVAYIGVVGGVLGLSGLYLTWASYRDDRAAEAPDLTVEQVADQFADAVREQWTAEAELRRLNDPYALPVRWQPADPGLVEDWPALVRLASGDGTGWPDPPPAGTWADGPGGLAGGGGELVQTLGRVPTGRLVVLGQPGAGKTIMLVRLVLDLLARRPLGAPVPVLVGLASWDPISQPLYGWLENQMIIGYPDLADPAPGREGTTRAMALLTQKLIVPVLDGLDEIPEAVRGGAIARINEALRPGQRLVLASRSQSYQQAVNPAGGTEIRLTGAAAVELRPLDATAVADYLCASAGGPTSATRWNPVLDILTATPPPPVAQALTTPLAAALARAVYNPRPGEQATAVSRSPVELLDPAMFPSRAAVDRHLFDAFIPAAYRPHPARGGRWEAARAERWLIFLARHLEHNQHGNPDLAWWQLPTAIAPRRPWLTRLAVGLAAGLGVGLWAGLAAGLAVGLAFGLWAGFVAERTFGRVLRSGIPARAMRWRPRGDLAVRLTFGLVLGLVAGLTFGFAVGFWAGLAFGLAVGLTIGLWAVLSRGFEAAPADLTAASPRSALVQDRITCRSLALAVGLTFGLTAGFTVEPTVGLTFGLTFGLAAGLGAGVTAGVFGATSWQFSFARAWLAARGRLPRQLMVFLADAHERGVLRQVGAVYQFRHVELQRRLASR